MNTESTMYVRLDGDNFTVVKSSRHFYKGRFRARTYDRLRQGSSQFVQVGDTGFTVVKTRREFMKKKIALTERVGMHIKTRLYLEANDVDRKMELLRKMAEFDKLGLTQTIDILPVDEDTAPQFDTIDINIPEFYDDDAIVPEYGTDDAIVPECGTVDINIWDVSVTPDIEAVGVFKIHELRFH
jgi:hypothetical protein